MLFTLFLQCSSISIFIMLRFMCSSPGVQMSYHQPECSLTDFRKRTVCLSLFVRASILIPRKGGFQVLAYLRGKYYARLHFFD